ncbi:TPA: DEAD/DEAH box helicase [Vibrio parahaemolyticus]
MGLRDYQKELVSSTLSCSDNVLIQADTGAGKTRILSVIAKSHTHVLLVAHRNALVSQLSLEFAKTGLFHNMISSKSTARRAETLHRRNVGRSLLSLKSNRFVCSIDTLLSKASRKQLDIDVNEKWLIIVDEAHHVTEENKWGKLAAVFKRSRIVGATATPSRLDGVPLKRGMGGVFDRLLQAESLKTDSVAKLIQRGFLSPFKCFGVESRLNDDALKLGRNDYTTSSLINETGKHVQEMAGDAVLHYKKLAYNKQAVAFCVSIEIAKKTAEAFRQAGISSAAIHSKMGSKEVNNIFDLFESGQIKVLCNVDMTGEGVDIPALEVLIMLRKTASLTLYRQWVGRVLRICTGKSNAIIIDHADNIRRHGLPDSHITWSLEHSPVEQKSNLISCKHCNFLVKAWAERCPECGELLRSESSYSDKDVKYIDCALVEFYRTKHAQESRDNALASTVPLDDIRYLNQHGNKVGSISTKVALWFFDNIKEDITRKQAEDFFFRNNNMQFWASHFTLSDLNKSNRKKCLKVFNEAQRN